MNNSETNRNVPDPRNWQGSGNRSVTNMFIDLGMRVTLSEEQFFEEIRLSLEQNEQVKLSGYGNFDLRDKKQRPGRNPKTGEEIPIKARRVVTFRPGQKLKSRVEGYAGTDE